MSKFKTVLTQCSTFSLPTVYKQYLAWFSIKLSRKKKNKKKQTYALESCSRKYHLTSGTPVTNYLMVSNHFCNKTVLNLDINLHKLIKTLNGWQLLQINKLRAKNLSKCSSFFTTKSFSVCCILKNIRCDSINNI
jgi:hypothetical protein